MYMRFRRDEIRQTETEKRIAGSYLSRVVKIQSAFGVRTRHPFMRYILSTNELVRHAIVAYNQHTLTS